MHYVCPTCAEFRPGKPMNTVPTLNVEHATYTAFGQVCCVECYFRIYDPEQYELPLQLHAEPRAP